MPDSRSSTGEKEGRYRTIVADPPWEYEPFPVGAGQAKAFAERRGIAYDATLSRRMPYAMMTVEQIKALPVESLAADDAHLYLWTTNRYLRDAFDVLEAWGFRYSQMLAWCKTPMGLGPGATYANTIEPILVGKRGSLKPLRRWDSAWFNWKRMGRAHSRKPDAMLDVVEQVSPGPHLELFARRARFGWDYWGDESLGTATMPSGAA
jgi:N6-adenosine-specific RNA methylase IME4